MIATFKKSTCHTDQCCVGTDKQLGVLCTIIISLRLFYGSIARIVNDNSRKNEEISDHAELKFHIPDCVNPSFA